MRRILRKTSITKAVSFSMDYNDGLVVRVILSGEHEKAISYGWTVCNELVDIKNDLSVTFISSGLVRLHAPHSHSVVALFTLVLLRIQNDGRGLAILVLQLLNLDSVRFRAGSIIGADFIGPKGLKPPIFGPRGSCSICAL